MKPPLDPSKLLAGVYNHPAGWSKDLNDRNVNDSGIVKVIIQLENTDCAGHAVGVFGYTIVRAGTLPDETGRSRCDVFAPADEDSATVNRSLLSIVGVL